MIKGIKYIVPIFCSKKNTGLTLVCPYALNITRLPRTIAQIWVSLSYSTI